MIFETPFVCFHHPERTQPHLLLPFFTSFHYSHTLKKGRKSISTLWRTNGGRGWKKKSLRKRSFSSLTDAPFFELWGTFSVVGCEIRCTRHAISLSQKYTTQTQIESYHYYGNLMRCIHDYIRGTDPRDIHKMMNVVAVSINVHKNIKCETFDSSTKKMLHVRFIL